MHSIKPIIPTDYQTCMQMAETIAKSGLGPATLNTKEKVFFVMQIGAGLGLTPMQSVQSISVINGKPALYGDTMLAIVKASGQLESFNEYITNVNSEIIAVCVVKRKNINEVKAEFSVSDAKKAGLWERSSPWRQYPERMLKMRARCFALRDVFPDLLLGLQHSAEELSDSDVHGNDKPSPKPHDNLVLLKFDEGENTVEIPVEEGFDFFLRKITEIGDEQSLEEFQEWSKRNDIAKKTFSTYNREGSRQLGVILSDIKEKIKAAEDNVEDIT
jgi:hypothetical protein